VRTWARALFGAALLMLAIVAVVSAVLFAVVLVHASTDSRRPADAIIVLGAGLRPDNTPNRALIRRSLHGATLWADGIAPIVVCSGGIGRNRTRSEADACRELLVANGVPAEAIVLEEQSRSTEENALYTHRIFGERGWDTAVIVSDGYHLFRARWIFALEGLTVWHSPAAPTNRGDLARSSLREVLALHWLFVKTALGLPFTYVPVF
jgi:uncharacterized SAM-binding protein YcdF (DUF218 family)